jgi:hypothetical protein
MCLVGCSGVHSWNMGFFGTKKTSQKMETEDGLDGLLELND